MGVYELGTKLGVEHVPLATHCYVLPSSVRTSGKLLVTGTPVHLDERLGTSKL